MTFPVAGTDLHKMAGRCRTGVVAFLLDNDVTPHPRL